MSTSRDLEIDLALFQYTFEIHTINPKIQQRRVITEFTSPVVCLRANLIRMEVG